MAANPTAAVAEVESLLDDRTRDLLARRRLLNVRRRGWLVRRALLLADLAGLLAAFFASQALTTGQEAPFDRFDTRTEDLLFLASLPGWVVLAKLYGLYARDEERADHSTADDLVGVFHLVTVGTWGFFAFTWLTGLAHPQVSRMVVFWLLAPAGVTVARAVGRAICRRQVEYLQNTVIVGTGEAARSLARTLRRYPDYGLNLVGFVSSTGRQKPPVSGDVPHVGTAAELDRVVEALDIERVIVAPDADFHCSGAQRVINSRSALDLQIDIIPESYGLVGPGSVVYAICGFPVIGLQPMALSRSSALLKRALDVAVALWALALLLPLLLVIALAIKLETKGPVLYRHKRLGWGGREFELLKFRTMRLEFCRGDAYGGAEAELAFTHLMRDPARRSEFEDMYKLEHDPRVTRVGGALRRTSLDELPQLVNVLRGEMSVVGPRPITSAELHRYGERASALLSVRPGVTGYWQVNGRSRLGYEERVRLDLAYVGSWTLKLDLSILIATLRVLIGRRGAL